MTPLFDTDHRTLFGTRGDIGAFLLPTLISIALLFVGRAMGILHSETPFPLWLLAVVFVDVAHVWSTLFRVYLDKEEVGRRRALYLATPIACWSIGIALFRHDPMTFWRVLAYIATLHFVRQQIGWVRLLNRRAGNVSPSRRHFDDVVVYAITLWPLLHWHAHLPARFHWLIAGDFAALPIATAVRILEPVYWLLLAAFVVLEARVCIKQRLPWNTKLAIVVTTWFCWWAGIVWLRSDYAFTVTNVLIHGVPYFVLTFRYARAAGQTHGQGSAAAKIAKAGWLPFLGVAIAFALTEEHLWDGLVWHEHFAWVPNAWTSPSTLEAAQFLIVPLLAVPQATHYVLDGFIWRSNAKNPVLVQLARSQSPT